MAVVERWTASAASPTASPRSRRRACPARPTATRAMRSPIRTWWSAACSAASTTRRATFTGVNPPWRMSGAARRGRRGAVLGLRRAGRRARRSAPASSAACSAASPMPRASSPASTAVADVGLGRRAARPGAGDRRRSRRGAGRVAGGGPDEIARWRAARRVRRRRGRVAVGSLAGARGCLRGRRPAAKRRRAGARRLQARRRHEPLAGDKPGRHAEPLRQVRRVVRRVDLDVVVEVAIHVAPGPPRRRPRRGQARVVDLRAAPPGVDARRPSGRARRRRSRWRRAPRRRAGAGRRSRRSGPRAAASGRRCRRRRGRSGAAAAARRRPGRRSSDGGSRPRGAAAGRVDLERARPARRPSCRRASASAAPVSRGSSAKKASKRAASKPSCGGNCQRIGPSLAFSRNTPEAKKFASGTSHVVQLQHVRDVARALDARTRSRRASASCHSAYDSGRCSE